MVDPNLNSGPQFDSRDRLPRRNMSIDEEIRRSRELMQARRKLSAEPSLELIYDIDPAKTKKANDSESGVIDKVKFSDMSKDVKLFALTPEYRTRMAQRNALILGNIKSSEWSGFSKYKETTNLDFVYDPLVYGHLFEVDDSINSEDIDKIKTRFESEESEYVSGGEKMTLQKFIMIVFLYAVEIHAKDLLEKKADKNAYGYNEDFSGLPDAEKAEKLAKKKKIFDFFVDFGLLPAGLDFDEVANDENHEYHNFFKIAFVNLVNSVCKFDEKGDLIESEIDTAKYTQFIEKYAEVLGIDKVEVKGNLDEYLDVFVQVKKTESILENIDDYESITDVLEYLNNEEEEKEKKKKKKEEEKKPVDVLAAISGVSDSSLEESYGSVGGEIIEQLDPPPYIQNFIKEGRVDDNGNYVCDLKDYDVNLVFTQDPDTKEYRLEIKDQKAEYASEIIKLNDKSGNKEWDRVEYNIDKLTSLAVVSDLGLTSFFNAGSDLKMMQFVHLMVVPNVKSIANVEPDQWYKRANKKDMPLLKRSAAVTYIKRFFELDGESKITKDAWQEKLNNQGLLDKGGKMKPMHRLVVNKEFLEAKQKFAARVDSEAEEANRNTT